MCTQCKKEEYSKIKHLEFVTGAIERMARNSSTIKAWTIGLFGAFVALENKSASMTCLGAEVVIITLWWIDSFYLQLEEKFRLLFDDVRLGDYSADPYTMNTRKYNKDERLRTMWQIMTSTSEIPYLVFVAIIPVCWIIVVLYKILCIQYNYVIWFW